MQRVTSMSARASTERPFYGLHAEAYDLLITDPVGPWVTAVHNRMLREGRREASILDAGCGTGRHAAGLIAKGHRVDLADASVALLSQAAERCPASRTFRVDLCIMHMPQSYEAVTCRGVLNDMTTEQERSSAMTSLAQSLLPGGLLFLDVREERGSWQRADGTRRSRTVDLAPGRQLTFSSATTWDAGLLRVTEQYHLVIEGQAPQSCTYHFTMRPWSTSELHERLHENGMRRIEISHGVGRRTCDRLFVVAS